MRGKRTVPSLFFSICLCLLPLCISVILSLGQCLFLCCYIAMYLYVSFSFFCLFLCFCLQSIRLSLSLSLFFFFLLALSTSFSCYQTIYVFLLFLPFSCSLSFSSSLTISWYRHSFLSCYLSLAVSLSLTYYLAILCPLSFYLLHNQSRSDIPTAKMLKGPERVLLFFVFWDSKQVEWSAWLSRYSSKTS